jgi:hypothetical protein
MIFNFNIFTSAIIFEFFLVLKSQSFLLLKFRLAFKTEASNKLLPWLQFLSTNEYLKGIEIYESIIKELSSYHGNTIDEETKAEL